MLPRSQTHLWWLSDILVLAAPFPAPAAFSVGDILVAAGLFWLLQTALTRDSPRPRNAQPGELVHIEEM